MNVSGRPDGGTAPSASRYRPGVLGRDPALLAADAQLDRAPLAAQLLEPFGRAAAQLRLVEREVADPAQHVVERVDAVRSRAVGEPLQVGLDGLQRGRLDQLAQLLLAEQLAQQLAIQRQRGGAPLGVGLVALVHVGRDVVEQQRARERGGGRRLDLDQAQLAPVQLRQQLVQAREVQHVAQDLAVGLEHDRELRVAARDLEQRLRLQPLLPQRRALARDRRAGSAARGRRSRGSGRRTARSRRARRPPGPRARRGRSASAPRPGGSSASGRWTMIPSSDQIASDSRPYSSRMRADSARPQAACTRPPNGRQHADPPVPDLVAEALDHDRAVARHDARRLLLLAQELDEVGGGLVVEVVVVRQRRRLLVHGPAGEGADRLAQLAWPAEPVALPERDGARDARRGRDDHAVARDLLDPPASTRRAGTPGRGAPRRPSPRRARRRGGRPAG